MDQIPIVATAHAMAASLRRISMGVAIFSAFILLLSASEASRIWKERSQTRAKTSSSSNLMSRELEIDSYSFEGLGKPKDALTGNRFKGSNLRERFSSLEENFITTPSDFVFPGNISGLFEGSWMSSSIPKYLRTSFNSEGYGLIWFSVKQSSSLVDLLYFHSLSLFVRDPYNSRDQVRFFYEGLYKISEGKGHAYANISEWYYRNEVRSWIPNDIDPKKFIEMERSNFSSNSVKRPESEDEQSSATLSENLDECDVHMAFQLGSVSIIDAEKDKSSPTNDKNRNFKGLFLGPFSPSWQQKGNILSAQLESQTCNFTSLSIMHSVDDEIYLRKAFNYAVFFMIIALIQIYATLKQLEYSTPAGRGVRVSLISLVILALLDSYLSLLNLTFAVIIEQLFNIFMVVSLIQFIGFSLFQMRLILIVWKARNPELFNLGFENVRNELAKLYMRFYLLMFMGLMAIYALREYLSIITIFLYLFWIPQIVQNILEGHRASLLPSYVRIVTLCRFITPLCKIHHDSDLPSVLFLILCI